MEKVNCKIDGQVCDIARPALASLEKCVTPKVAVIQRLLPCLECKEAKVFAMRLSGLRLGKHDKHVLLAAPSSDQNRIVIDPVGGGRSAEEIHRRAIRKLGRIGLVSLGDKPISQETEQKNYFGKNVKRIYHRRTVQLTPLGTAIVEKFGDKIKAGKTIRWSDHVTELVEAVNLTQSELVAVFQNRLEEYAGNREAIRETV